MMQLSPTPVKLMRCTVDLNNNPCISCIVILAPSQSVLFSFLPIVWFIPIWNILTLYHFGRFHFDNYCKTVWLER